VAARPGFHLIGKISIAAVGLLIAIALGRGRVKHPPSLRRSAARASASYNARSAEGDAIDRVLPQVHRSFKDVYLQLLGVIQSLALTELLMESTDLNWSATESWIRVATVFFIIVGAWQEYMVGATVFVWVPTVVDSIAPFALGAVEFYLARTVGGDAQSYLLATSGTYLVGVCAYGNYAFQVRRGHEGNRISLVIFSSHVRFGLALCIGALIGSLILLTLTLHFHAEPVLMRRIIVALTVIPPMALIGHFVPHWNMAIRRARRASRQVAHGGPDVY
jgi:hypothetical protein